MLLNINLAMQLTIPILVSFVEGFAFEADLRITPWDLFTTCVLHAIYVLCFLFAFLTLRDKPVDRIRFLRANDGCDARVLVFVAIGTYVTVRKLIAPDPFQTYEQLAGIARAGTTLYDVLTTYLQTMFEWTSTVAAVIFLTLYRGRWHRTLKIAVVVYCILYLVRSLTLGLRGGLFIFLMLGLFFAYVQSGRIRAVYALVIGFCALSMFSYLGGPYREQLYSLADLGTLDRLQVMVDGMTRSRATNEASGIAGTIDGLYHRLEASRDSVSLVRLFNAGHGVSLTPTTSALTAFIPARLGATPYYVTSSTADVFGTAMHVVRRETYGASDMGPYLASAHQYWEGGILYLVFGGLLCGWIWRAAVRWCIHSGTSTASLLLLGSLLDAHHGELSVTAPVALFIRLFWYQLVPMAALLVVLKMWPRRLRLKHLGAAPQQPPHTVNGLDIAGHS